PNFFQLFPMRTVVGRLADALRRPDGIFRTRSVARRFFGRDDVVGETVELNPTHVMRVTAVIEDLPSNTRLVGDVFLPGAASFSELSLQDAVKRGSGQIKSFSIYTYARLQPGANVNLINAALPGFVARHFTDELEGVPLSRAVEVTLSPVTHAHLQPR